MAALLLLLLTIIALLDSVSGQLYADEYSDLPATPPYSIFANINSNSVRGYITIESTDGSTNVIKTSLRYSDGRIATQGHQWRIHTGRPIKPDECSTSRAMYDPSNRASSAAYQCTQGNIQACAEGDMSGKFGPLAIGTSNIPSVTPGFTDTSFSISDIYGGSFLIYKIGAGVDPSLDDSIACGIIQIPRDIAVQFDGNSVGSIRGNVRMVQSLTGEIIITPTLTQGGASSSGHAMNVRKMGQRFACVTSSSDLYDPTNRIGAGGGMGDYNCNPTTPDQCFSGDLTGKNQGQGLTLPSVAGEVMSEKSMDLYDVIGRSLAVQIQNEGESLIGCARIVAPVLATETMRLVLGVGCSVSLLLVFIVVQFVAE